MMLARAATIIGCVVLLHAGYSANQYKGLLQSQGADQAYPPLDVLIECVVSFALILLGQTSTLQLESIQLLPDKRFMAFADRFGAPEFARFNHRGREFHARSSGNSGKKR